MKKVLLISLGLLFSSHPCFAQIEITESVFPTYQGVVDIAGVPKDAGYDKIKAWVATNFVSANDVIQFDDRNSGKMILKGNTEIPIRSVGMVIPVRVHFALTIDVRDDRFRYTYTVNDITSGSPSRSIMRDMDRDNKRIIELKALIVATFTDYMSDLRTTVISTDDDDW